MSRNESRSRLFLCLSGLLLLCLAGCSSDPSLRLTRARDQRTYTQPFFAAYASHSDGGESQIVLVDNPAESSTAPVRQVMHIRVLWNPTRELKPDHTSASNATVHWYVLGNTPQTRTDVLEYSGTALVALDESGGTTEVTIRSATLRPAARRGNLFDPLGASNLQGTIIARNDPRKVTQVLSGVRTIVTEANATVRDAGFKARPEAPSSSAR